jgi:uncharacterized protein YqeY
VETEPAAAGGGPGSVRDRLRRALPAAIKARDAPLVVALRSALAAIDNAESVDAAQARLPAAGHADFALSVAGLRAAEVARASLTEAQAEEIVRAEVADRRAVADQYESAGQRDHAERLRREADALNSHLDGPEPPAF